jgi:hypothetical protein
LIVVHLSAVALNELQRNIQLAYQLMPEIASRAVLAISSTPAENVGMRHRIAHRFLYAGHALSAPQQRPHEQAR